MSKVVQLYYWNRRPETMEKSLARIKDGKLHKLIDKVCEKIPSL